MQQNMLAPFQFIPPKCRNREAQTFLFKPIGSKSHSASALG